MMPFGSFARARSLLGVLLVVALAAACSGGGGSGGDEESSLGPASRLASDESVLAHAKQYKGEKLTLIVPDPLDKWLGPGTKEFEKQTGVDVEFQIVPFDQLLSKYSTLATGQDSSVDMYFSWAAITAQMGPLLFQDLSAPLKGVSAEYSPAALSSMQAGGKTYGLPYQTSIQIMYYNKALFTAAGLDPAKPPATWTEFVDAAKAVKSKGGANASGFVTGGQTANDVFAGLWLPALNSADGHMYSSDLRKATVDTPQSRAAMQALADLGKSGAVSPQTWSNNGSQDAALSFAKGNVGMTWNFPLAYPIVADPKQSDMKLDDLGTALIPGVELESGSVNGAEGIAVSRYSENQAAALDYVAYITSPTQQKALSLGEAKLLPARTKSLSDKDVVKAIPVAPLVAKQGEFPADRAGSPFYNDVSEVVAKWVGDVMRKDLDPGEATKGMQREVTKVVDDYWADNG
ncbi:MAG: extracellular solute-binding protein [Streptosporangiales bacterium]|nr:extracellular solute-binding protein [Streptosporangiales bacterium]